MGFRGRLLLITAAGAVWRLGYLLAVKADQELLLNDSLYFSIQADLNAEGSWFNDALTGQPGAEHGALTSLYLTPWSVAHGSSVLAQRFAITLLGIATVYVIGVTGRRLAVRLGTGSGDLAGLAAAGIAAVYPNLWINDSLVMSETPAMLLVSLSLYVALGHHANPTLRSGVALGVLVALGALTRSEIALFIPGFAILSAMLCRRRGRPIWPALAIAGAAAMTLLPWTLYNTIRFEEPVLLSTNDGNTLLGANCDTTYYDDIGGWDIRCLGPLEPGRLGHEPGAPDASQRSKVRRDEAIDYIGDHLDRLPVVVGARVGRVLDAYGLDSMVALDVGEEKAAWAAWTGIACWWVLAAAAVAGYRALARAGATTRWWLLVPCVAVLVTTVLFYGAHRIRAPAEPAVVLLAAVAAAAFVARRRGAGTLAR